MEEIPSKPYLIRALHEWCTDNGYTPYIIVNVDANTRVPHAHVRDGQITLNISALATQHLMLDNERITFQARFGGVTEHVFVPTSAVLAIYARETGTGMGFEQLQVAAADNGATTNPVVTTQGATESTGANPRATPMSGTKLTATNTNTAAPPATPAQARPNMTTASTNPAANPGAGSPRPDDPTPPGAPRRPRLTVVK